jgi:hypothetical protein
MEPKPTTRAEIRELLREEFPSLPIAKQPLTLSQRIDRSLAEVQGLQKIVTKRRAVK